MILAVPSMTICCKTKHRITPNNTKKKREIMAKLFTPVATLSYPALFSPKAVAGSKPKYGAVLVFLPDANGKLRDIKGGVTDLKEMMEAAKAVAIEKWGDKYAQYYKVDNLFHTDEDKGYPPGAIFINIGAPGEDKNGNKLPGPGVVSKFKDPATGKARIITDPSEMYPGCQVVATVNPYAWEYEKIKRGVSFGLQNICKVGEGERLDGRKSAADEFEGQEPEAADGVDDLL